MKKNKYTITYLPLFYEDLENIIRYIVYDLENKNAAEKLLQHIENAILKRSENPEAFEQYESKKARKQNWYRIYVRNYTIFYVVTGDCMEVRRIVYSRRNLKNII